MVPAPQVQVQTTERRVLVLTVLVLTVLAPTVLALLVRAVAGRPVQVQPSCTRERQLPLSTPIPRS